MNATTGAAAKASTATAPKANPQQVAALLKDLVGKCGLATQEALPAVKGFVEAGIFSLDSVSSLTSMPQTIPTKIQKKIISATKKRGKKQAAGSGGAVSPASKRRKTTPIVIPAVTVKPDSIMINRSPVLTLWASIVSEKLFDLKWEEALTFGSTYAAVVAQAKGTSLGIYTASEPKVKEEEKSSEDGAIRTFVVMDQTIQAKVTSVGLRAIVPDKKGDNTDNEQDPHWTWNHLQKKFGKDELPYVVELMKQAANNAVSRSDNTDYLANSAYQFYMHIRPDIPHGTKGWGAHGHLRISKLQDFY